MHEAATIAAHPIPGRPQVPAWLTCVDMGDERLSFRATEYAWSLRHPTFVRLFRRIRPLLDGSHAVDDIVAGASETFLPTTVRFLLRLLAANGAIMEGSSATAGAHSTRQFLDRTHGNVGERWAALCQARIGICGSPRLASRIRDSLGSAGVSDVLAVELHAGGESPRLEIPAAATLDLLVVCHVRTAFGFFDEVDRACLAAGVRWLRVAGDELSVLLGPTVVPRFTACHECYIRRVASNDADPEGFLAYHEALRGRAPVGDESMSDAMIALAASQVTLEVIRMITGFAPPTTLGRFYHFTVRTPSVEGHDVLRLPRCPRCASPPPPMSPWGLELEAEL